MWLKYDIEGNKCQIFRFNSICMLNLRTSFLELVLYRSFTFQVHVDVFAVMMLS